MTKIPNEQTSMQIPTSLVIEHLIFSPLVFVIFVLLALLWPIAKRPKKNYRLRWMVFIFLGLFLVSSHGFFQIFSWPLKQLTPESQKHKADAIVVATAGIHESGAPSPGSTTRAYTAAQLYLEGWAPLILVTGGVTRAENPHAEAIGAHIILRGMGVPDEDILIENQAVNTYTNSTRSAEILNARKLKNILLVTHDYHLLRLTLAFEQLGFTIFPYAANTPPPKKDKAWWQYFNWENFNKLQTYAHEYIGLLTYKIRGWI